MTKPSSLYLLYHSLNEGITCWQLIHPKVHMSIATTLPRRSASRSGASTFSQTSFVNSGAGPRSGREADLGIVAGGSLSGSGAVTVPQAASPNKSSPKASPARAGAAGTSERSRRIQSRFIISLLDSLMIQKLPYEKITKG